MADFEYAPSRGFTQDVAPSVHTAKFGDGYAQRVIHGINNIASAWSLLFQSQPLADADAIIAFFESKAGATSFTWLPPDEATEVLVICTKWNKTYESEISRNITATFERVYGA